MAKERQKLGLGKTILLFLLSGIVIATAVVAPQVLKKSSNDKLEVSMKQDLLNVKSGVSTGLKKLPTMPTIKVIMATTNANWSFTTFDGNKFASGVASKGDILSGTVYTDNSFCLQVANSGSSKIWHIDSTTSESVNGFCLIRRATSPLPAGTPTPSVKP